MLISNDKLFEKIRKLSVKDILFSSCTVCENAEILVFVIRNGDVVLFGLPFNQHHPVVRWIPWFDDIKKKICAITVSPNTAEWTLAVCADKSLILIPVLYLLGFGDKDSSLVDNSDNWSKYDITELMSPFHNDNDFVPCAVAWFNKPEHDPPDRHVAVVGSTSGQIVVFSLFSAQILFTTKINGRTSSIEVCNRINQVFIIVSNEFGDQWRILLSKVESDSKDDNTSDTSDEQKVSLTELKTVITTQTDINQWKMKYRHRLKKPSAPLLVECGKEEMINCGPEWQLIVKLQSVIESSLNVHTSCISAMYPSKILTIEDYSSHHTSVHKLPEHNGIVTITKSLIIFTNETLNQLKIISRNLSSCKDESSNVMSKEFIKESLLEEYIFDDIERVLKVYCTNYLKDRCIIITNQALYSLRLKTDPHKLVLNSILEKDNLELAEKLTIVFNLDLSTLIYEAGDIMLSRGLMKEAIQLYNITKCGGTRFILKLAVLGRVPELYDALQTCHYSPTCKLLFMNLKVLVSLHQLITSYSSKYHSEFRSLLLLSGYDESLAVSALVKGGFYSELLFLTLMKGLQPITMQDIFNLFQHNYRTTVSHYKSFWNLISDQSFCDTLLMKPHLFLFHHKLVLQQLPNMSEDILRKLEALYNPFSVSLTPWLTTLVQGDVPVELWIQTYILICAHLSARENKFSIDTVGGITLGQEWSFVNPKIGVHENKLSSGFSHAAVVVDGNLYSWGSTSFCCLGNGPTTRPVSGPIFIDKFYNIGVRVLSIACGRNHTLAITENGVYSWGNNNYGQLGRAKVIQSSYPTLIEALIDFNIVQIAAGQYHSIALDDNNRVFTWGWGVHGQLGHGHIDDCFIPKLVSTFSKEKIIFCAAGQAHSLFLNENGTVWACGSNTFGQLGIGKSKKSSIPVQIIALTDKIKTISVGFFHNFAINYNEEMFTWGCSPNLLRIAAHSAKRKTKISSEEKKEITVIEDSFEFLLPRKVDISSVKGNIVKVVAGSEHNALLTDEGNIYTWGRNMDGQLGIKTSSVAERHSQNILIPTLIVLGAPVTDVTCGFDFTVVVDSIGNIWTWGTNHCSSGCKGALSCLDGEVVMVNNKNRVIRFPHHQTNIQSLPTLLKIPLEQKLIRKDYKPVLPKILKTNEWRYRMHYAIEKCHQLYSNSDLINQCLLVGESDASAKLLLISGDISSALKITLKSAIVQPDSTSLLKSILTYYFSKFFLQSGKFSDLLVDVITFWNEHKLSFSHLEEVFYNSWSAIAIPLGDLFFRVDSHYSHFSTCFSTKFKLRLVEYMITHKSNNVDCIFEGCSNVKEILTALSKANDYVDVVLDPSDTSKKIIVFKQSSVSSNETDFKPS